MDVETQVVTIDDSILDAAWGDDSTDDFEATEPVAVDDSADQTVGDTEEQPTPDTEAEEPEQTNQEPKAEEPAPEQKPETFSLKHMDESKEYSREDVIALAQKGLDYDRIRTERDSIKAERNAARDHENFLEELAKDAGVSVEQLIDDVRADRLIRREQEAGRTLSELGAKEQIQREKTARAEENKPEEKEPEEKKPDEPHATNSTNDDVLRFVKAYPNVQAKDIPQSVWDDVRNGTDLISAYTRYENAQLRSQIETMQQNEKNKNRSTGSRQGTGNNPTKSVFDAAWDSSDY